MPSRLLSKLYRLDTLLSLLLNHPQQLLFLHSFQPSLLFLPLDRDIRFIIFHSDHVLNILQSILHLLPRSRVSTTCHKLRILALRQIYQVITILIKQLHLVLAI